MLVAVVVFFGLAVLYLSPAFIAALRLHNNANPIFVVNLLLGWTIAGWVLCLAWSLSSNVYERGVR